MLTLSTLTFKYETCVCLQGVTFRVENGELVIARILHGGMIDQQGLLHVGDIIKEVNGKEVGNDPKVLQEMLKEASGSVVLKILPSYQEPHTARQVSGENTSKVCFKCLHLFFNLQPLTSLQLERMQPLSPDTLVLCSV